MADQLASPTDLASFLQQDLDASTANLLINCATAVVQEAAGQRIVQVVNDPLTIMGTTDSWLAIPQIPVTAVASVTLDGTTLTASAAGVDADAYRRHGNRLWRTNGWQTYIGEPSTVVVTCTHGYQTGDYRLQLATGHVLALCAPFYDNPSGASSVKIDDYAATYSAMQAAMAADTHGRRALRRAYGRRAAFARAS